MFTPKCAVAKLLTCESKRANFFIKAKPTNTGVNQITTKIIEAQGKKYAFAKKSCSASAGALKMTYNSYFEEVTSELRQISKAAKHDKALAWVVLPAAFLAHACVLAVTAWSAGWLFGNSPMVVGVICAAYISSVIGWAVKNVQQQVIHMAVHATSIHDEVLLVKELIQDEQRRSVKWR